MQRIEKFILALAILVTLGIASSKVHSFDVFWQLQSGRHILETKAFIYRDIFSLAAEAPRFEHCWLHDVLLFAVWSLAGYAGISFLKGLLVAGTAAVALAAGRVRGSSCLSILLLFAPLFFLTIGGWLERPQLWSFLLFVVFLLLLERFRRQGGRQIFLLLPLMLLWVNLHAGAVLAIPVVAAYLVGTGGEVLLRRSAFTAASWRRLALVLALLPLVSMANPYGVKMLETIVVSPNLGETSGVIAQIANMDWRPTIWANNPNYFFALGGTLLFLLAGWKKLSLTDLLLLGGLAWMSLKLERHITFYYLALLVLLPRYVDAAGEWLLPRLSPCLLPLLRLMGLCLSLLLLGHFAWPQYKVHGFFAPGLREWHYPISASRFIENERLPKNLYNTYDWGGYLMWTLYPKYLVYWDGRSDSLAMFERGNAVMRGDPGWEKILREDQVKTIITRCCTIDTAQHYPLLDRLREDPQWSLVYADDSALVFVRDDAVAADWLSIHRLEKSRIDDAILIGARMMTAVDPSRYMGWWEIARIYLDRKDYEQAFLSLRRHLETAPKGKHIQTAENYFRILYPMMNTGEAK